MTMKHIGVVGCGLMGSGIATNLLKKAYQVHVYDINKESVQRLAQKGAIAEDNIPSLAEKVDIMILSLPSPSLIKTVLTDCEEGAFVSMRKGSYILDMSTNDVEVTRELHAVAGHYGLAFLDCPLSGGPDGAESGTLTIMVGGNEDAFSNVLPVLESMGTNIDYIGESGSGQIVKLCNNMLVGGVISLLSEALITAEKAGVSQEKIARVFQKGSAQTKVMDVFGPNILNRSFEEVKFSLANMLKDMNLYRNLAEDHLISTLSSQSALQLFQIAGIQQKGGKDSTAVYEVVRGMLEVKET
ncbi:3-hydroxyisobutyrate dehydrogenase [Lentibacillus sp. JNUCC-1]|uniref:NAD(P)-dependent oxidoreductase n=1 Tax=Lentibacillus sp. JNUCC-1 TaxID=2654513 RepID=UPI0012E77E2C|nr:NAD(P)-dependent oxidoreductase [Lentibacillus sp. JNUCC-1]MUV36952.1 3-hydroxyisobutyrate dehydrogenase [Lentibacillus sp. JNUCC-1]